MILFALIWILNFAISIWNSYSVGRVWTESKIAGGYIRLMCWMGAVMASVGFSFCYLSLVGLSVHQFGYLDTKQVDILFKAGYVILVPVALFAGWAITIDSLVQAWRERNFVSVGLAGWNLFTSVHNTYSAYQNLGTAFSSLVSYSEEEDNSLGLVLTLLLFSIFAGVFTAWAIIMKVNASRRTPENIF